MAIDFPSSPSDGDTVIVGTRTWVYSSSVPGWVLALPWISGATGGTEDTFVGDGTIGESGVTYARHTYTADGTLVVPATGDAEFFLVGAGGQHGRNTSTDIPGEQIGAGGAGGIFRGKYRLAAGTHTVKIGQPPGANSPGAGNSGGPTSVGPYVAVGGGNGGNGRNRPGSPGGCGGGGGDGTGTGGLGVPGQGYAGGNGGGSPDGGGGGGTSGAGSGPTGGPGTVFQGTTYGVGGSVVSTGLSGSEPANTGNGASYSQGNSSEKLAAAGIAIIFYPA